MTRRILVVANPHRTETLEAAEVATAALADEGVAVCAGVREVLAVAAMQNVENAVGEHQPPPFIAQPQPFRFHLLE